MITRHCQHNEHWATTFIDFWYKNASTFHSVWLGSPMSAVMSSESCVLDWHAMNHTTSPCPVPQHGTHYRRLFVTCQQHLFVTSWRLNYTMVTRNVPHYFCPYLRQFLTDFQNSFTGTIGRQFAIMWLLYIFHHTVSGVAKGAQAHPDLDRKHKHTFKLHEIGQFKIIKIVATRSHF